MDLTGIPEYNRWVVTMTDDISYDKIEISIAIIGVCSIIMLIYIFLGNEVPGIILLIFGISAMIVGSLKLISIIYPDLFN